MAPSDTRSFRLDELLVRRGLLTSRAQAQSAIHEGRVQVAGVMAIKPALRIPENAEIIVAPPSHNYVSRGGLKLAHGLDVFGFDVKAKLCLDVGASTGGFTDVLLSRGARHVYALDVGHDQLAPSLRNDPRVTLMEGVNARYLKPGDLAQAPDIIVCDVSFISLTLILPPVLALGSRQAKLVALIKPQFELTPTEIGKGGIVRDHMAHKRACQNIATLVANLQGWQIVDVIDSPITGADGNREYLLGAYVN